MKGLFPFAARETSLVQSHRQDQFLLHGRLLVHKIPVLVFQQFKIAQYAVDQFDAERTLYQKQFRQRFPHVKIRVLLVLQALLQDLKA